MLEFLDAASGVRLGHERRDRRSPAVRPHVADDELQETAALAALSAAEAGLIASALRGGAKPGSVRAPAPSGSTRDRRRAA
jgi:hypothetical protein